MFRIGPYSIDKPALLAPMAGVTDQPFRKLCLRLGAGLTTSEMVGSNPRLRDTRKSRLRRQFDDEPGPRSVQIAGFDPQMMADAARFNVLQGAQIIDINMGCPAKKVCRRAAGSALLREPLLVAQILRSVTAAVDVPVTLKIRTGWDDQSRNAVEIARIAEDCGIAALAIHGRTRACRFNGYAEYATIREVVDNTSIPVIANGDIGTPVKAAQVLRETRAAAVMIGRAAQGNPWLFREINCYLRQGLVAAPPSAEETLSTMLWHLQELHRFYGEQAGVRIARKHIGWYAGNLAGGRLFCAQFNTVESALEQQRLIENFLQYSHFPTNRAA